MCMGPGGLCGEEVGEEQSPSEVIDGGDQSPLLLGEGRPQVGGSVVLEQGANGNGDHLAVMSFPFPARFVAAQVFGATDDGVEGHSDRVPVRRQQKWDTLWENHRAKT